MSNDTKKETGREAFDALKTEHQDILINIRVRGMNQVSAYMDVYPECSYDAARNNASRLLAKDSMRSAIQWFIDDAAATLGLSESYVLGKLKLIADGNIASLYDEQGSPKDIKDLTRDELYAVESIEEMYDPLDKSEVVGRRAKLSSRRNALQDIGKHLQMFTDKISINDGLPIHDDPATHAANVIAALTQSRDSDHVVRH